VCLGALAAMAQTPSDTLVCRGMQLRDHDEPGKALECFREAIAKEPHSLRAHAEYVRTKAYDLERFDEVRAEYTLLMRKEQDNPVYAMALATGQSLTPPDGKRAWYEIVARLAPESAWGLYARTQLGGEDEASTVANLAHAIELDPTLSDAWMAAIRLQEYQLHDLGGALAMASKLARLDDPELHAVGLYEVWRLRLLQEKDSPESVAALRQELKGLLATERSIDVLTKAYQACSNLLKDDAGATEAAAAIRAVDPAWYPERGAHLYFANANESSFPVQGTAVNRDVKVVSSVFDLDAALPAGEKIARLRPLLAESQSAGVKRLVYQRLFRSAVEASDNAAIIEFGEQYKEESGRVYPELIDAALLARIAIARADGALDLPRAAAYAREAYDATAVFQPWKTPRNTDETWMGYYDQKHRESVYQSTRALALEARGWTLCQTGQWAEGEPMLRKAVELRRGEQNLTHLAGALEELGRAPEAAEIRSQAQSEWLESLKRRMKKTPSNDFAAPSLDGSSVRLSSLKGKVVLVNFWATWCGPCVQEMPILEDLYRKYRDHGLEILAISVDEEEAQYKVGKFVKEHGLTFPVLYDNGIGRLYQVGGYPTSLLIDRDGMVRLRFNIAEKRSLDAMVAELLK